MSDRFKSGTLLSITGAAGNSDLVECDELGVESHEVSGLRHLAHHEGDEGGVTLPLFTSQRGFGQQHIGLDGVFNCRTVQTFRTGTGSDVERKRQSRLMILTA